MIFHNLDNPPKKGNIITSMTAGGLSSLFDFNSIFAFTSGILSFFTPCVLPLVPSYLIFISGITFDDYTELKSKVYRKIVLVHSVAFVLGFSFVFVGLGLSSSLIGQALSDYQAYITKIGGIFLIIMGVYYLNIIRIPFLDREKVIHLKKKPIGLLGSVVVGITFSLGWTPCIGPALSSILVIASTTESALQGMYLLSLYSLGLAIPFVISALIFDKLFGLLKRYGRIVQYTMRALGVLLIAIGILLVTSYWGRLSSWIGSLVEGL
jgi:cytochrome c-type biogenesis protein